MKALYLHAKAITCGLCGGSTDTLIKVGDNQYKHQKQLSCEAEKRRQSILNQRRPRKPRIVKPNKPKWEERSSGLIVPR